MLTRKRENPMAIRSRNAISQSLLKLMLYKPFGEISIADVTERAGLSRQTFYTNFQRKEDVLIYLLHGLFRRYQDRLLSSPPDAEDLLADYFFFWEDSRDFLALLLRHGLGRLFQDANRAFFMEDADCLDRLFTAERWQLPYIKAAVSGVTYELLILWVTEERGLPVDVLNALARNLLGGRIFG